MRSMARYVRLHGLRRPAFGAHPGPSDTDQTDTARVTGAALTSGSSSRNG
jgi:hypothetical protein